MTLLNRLDRSMTRGLEAVVTGCFFVLASFVVLLVVLRYLFNTTIIGGNEITGHLFIYTTALGAAVSVGTGQHIRIGVFVEQLPRRAKLLIDALCVLLILALHVGLFVLSIGWISSVGSFDIPVLDIPQGFIQVALPLGCFFVVLYCLIRLVDLIRAARTAD